MYRENDKNTENTKHTVKQPRQKINVHAHLHNLKRLYQSITALQRAASDFLAFLVRGYLYGTSNVTGRHRGPKRTLRTG